MHPVNLSSSPQPRRAGKTARLIVQILRFAFTAFLLAGACMRPANAASCNTWTSGNMSFGTVNLLAGGVVDSSSTINYGCSANPGTRVQLCVSMGPDPNTHLYTTRNLGSGSDRLAFNLYTDAARSTIWGDVNSGGSYPPVPVIVDFGSNDYYKTSTLTVYGRIQTAGQTGLPAGTYDTGYIGGWPMTVSYMEIPSNQAPNCSSAGMQSSSSTLYIQAVVQSDCNLGAISTMDFGTVFQSLTQNVDSTATITVTCNGGQGANGYHVGLGNGTNSLSGQRRLQGPGGYLNYELYRDAQRTSPWGSSYGYNDVSGVGNGQPQTLTVYGRVPAQTTPGVGTFTDTVVVTLTY